MKTECRSGCLQQQNPDLSTAAGEKESDLFKCQPSEKVGDSCHKILPNISVQARVCIRRERERERRTKKLGGRGYGRANSVFAVCHINL